LSAGIQELGGLPRLDLNEEGENFSNDLEKFVTEAEKVTASMESYKTPDDTELEKVVLLVEDLVLYYRTFAGKHQIPHHDGEEEEPESDIEDTGDDPESDIEDTGDDPESEYEDTADESEYEDTAGKYKYKYEYKDTAGKYKYKYEDESEDEDEAYEYDYESEDEADESEY
jgi:hypothetical protein